MDSVGDCSRLSDALNEGQRGYKPYGRASVLSWLLTA